MLVGRDISDVWANCGRLAGTIVMVALGGVAASLAGAWFLAGRALAPVQRINETARRMADGDLGARIAIERTDTELGQVASALNLAFDRLRESIERQRQFTADASHELRTPVATMMAELEWALLRERPAADYQESLETCHRAGARMQSLVEGLLTLARADSGELAVTRVSVRLDVLVDEAIELLRPLARQRGVTLRASLMPLTIAGDPDRLRELLSNLLFNAVAYNRAHGVVTCLIERAAPPESWTTTTPSCCGYATPASASTPKTSRACSIASIAASVRASASRPVPAWASRSSGGSSPRTTAPSSARANGTASPPSWYGLPATRHRASVSCSRPPTRRTIEGPSTLDRRVDKPGTHELAFVRRFRARRSKNQELVNR